MSRTVPQGEKTLREWIRKWNNLNESRVSVWVSGESKANTYILRMTTVVSGQGWAIVASFDLAWRPCSKHFGDHVVTIALQRSPIKTIQHSIANSQPCVGAAPVERVENWFDRTQVGLFGVGVSELILNKRTPGHLQTMLLIKSVFVKTFR